MGSSGAGVTAIQNILKSRGYSIDKVNGKFGSDTAAAISKFQRDNGLPVTGYIDSATLEKLTGQKGYASGTNNASSGLHKIDELGTETIFQSADGSKYKMFTGGEKVLNAAASNFLYDFANNGEDMLSKIMSGFFNHGLGQNVNSASSDVEINMGDIIINGSADEQTVSQIRREQRNAVEMILKEFNRLNK